ncbi:winged helix-turn-helix domain-containing protein [Streptomyces sp. NBC_01525]|uniref:Winged helix family transcriptional regulator n=1 Tax=Streptomyces benahoarensis TaxID=2595054 RepID=A0A553XRS8_9ACTN|nr:winged helix-turn-helix domain-containing protein [Streptomyces benahoarensis]TSB19582.1 winged helix family transcriptional regulator [Streptomyces benahoarensis]TSB20300.1 winged helix family transcriptional regulator [Streptomyces benahoarensis]
MTNIRPLPATSATAPVSSAPSPHLGRQRLRAVAPDEVPPVAELLTAGATWLPAPQGSLPVLPGRPPMVGYLVLVPAEQATAAGRRPDAAPAASGPPGEPAPETASGPGTVTDDEVVRIDPEQRTAQVLGRPLDLTYLEFELLAHLVAHPHRVHTRDQLVTTVWGYGHVGDGRTVDVHIARLRRKLGSDHRASIVTVRRVGYKYVPSA